MALIPTSSITSYCCANALQFPTDEEKINFAMTYLSSVAQDWFEVTLQQEDLSYI